MNSIPHRDRVRPKSTADIVAVMERFDQAFDAARSHSTIDSLIAEYTGNVKRDSEIMALEVAIKCYANACARKALSPAGAVPMEQVEHMLMDYNAHSIDASALIREIKKASVIALKEAQVGKGAKAR